jgi:hypothetical protein
MWNFILKNQKLITFSPQKRKHNTKLEEKRPKKTLKENHAKVLFTQKFMFDAKEIKHCTKKCLNFMKLNNKTKLYTSI